MKTILLVVVLGALLVMAAWGIGPFFAAYAGDMSLHGWIALGAGALLSIALGGGLMALSFYSARRGYDERAQWESEDEANEQ